MGLPRRERPRSARDGLPDGVAGVWHLPVSWQIESAVGDGPLAAVADTFGYRLLPGGAARLPALLRTAAVDTALRRELAGELERQAAASPMNFLGRQALRAVQATPQR